MRYRLSHTTVYRYAAAVNLCHNEAYLLPRATPHGQRCIYGEVRVRPQPTQLNERSDVYGNRVNYFAVETPHQELTVSAHSLVETAPPAPLAPALQTLAWEQARAAGQTDAAAIEARGLTLASPYVSSALLCDPTIAAFTQPLFSPGRPLLEAVSTLNQRIFDEFDYDPEFTTIITPLTEVLRHRRGVCQDFAHLMIACLRSRGLAARYVSGYLETLPPPGQAKLVGADASHAWVAVYASQHGWIDFDPTNNKRPDEQYITTAWGRDYGDVTPLKGVIFGGGEHKLDVAVDVERLTP